MRGRWRVTGCSGCDSLLDIKLSAKLHDALANAQLGSLQQTKEQFCRLLDEQVGVTRLYLATSIRITMELYAWRTVCGSQDKACLPLLHSGGEQLLLFCIIGKLLTASIDYRLSQSPVTVSVCGRPSGSKGRVDHPGRRMTHAALPVELLSSFNG
ncbi:hypothetical protein VTN77DRAFT_5499 [Rasamsonia byssochlamydoides]|uniref:uncharacterized protein n=1 Tax=Rasamsonia byssochlamydoides TaxID=89139 RepID=UPI003743A822